MLIVDAHLDLAWNALQWNRDLQTSVYTIRSRESHLTGAGRGQGTVALPDMRTGRIALCFPTLLARSTGRAVQNLDYSSPLQAYGVAQGQLAYYYGLQKAGEVHLIRSARHHPWTVANWLSSTEARSRTVRLVFIVNGDVLRSYNSSYVLQDTEVL